MVLWIIYDPYLNKTVKKNTQTTSHSLADRSPQPQWPKKTRPGRVLDDIADLELQVALSQITWYIKIDSRSKTKEKRWQGRLIRTYSNKEREIQIRKISCKLAESPVLEQHFSGRRHTAQYEGRNRAVTAWDLKRLFGIQGRWLFCGEDWNSEDLPVQGPAGKTWLKPMGSTQSVLGWLTRQSNVWGWWDLVCSPPLAIQKRN